MTVVRTMMIAALLFVGGFTLALEGWLERTTERETILLQHELDVARVARDQARDEFDVSVYQVLFQRRSLEMTLETTMASGEVPARQGSEPAAPSRTTPDDTPVVVSWADFTGHDTEIRRRSLQP